MDRDLNVLILDESADFVATLLVEMRAHGYLPRPAHVRTVEALAEALDGGSWDAVIADYSMPDFKAAGALNALRAKGLDVPLIVLSENLGEDLAQAALQAGAQDYLLKRHVRWIGSSLEMALLEAGERRSRREAGERQDGPGKPCVTCDARGIVTSCNDALLELLGYDRDDVVGRNWFQYFLPKGERERVEEAFLQVLATGSTAGLEEYCLLSLDGRRCGVRWKTSVLEEHSGRIVGTASVGLHWTWQTHPVPVTPS